MSTPTRSFLRQTRTTLANVCRGVAALACCAGVTLVLSSSLPAADEAKPEADAAKPASIVPPSAEAIRGRVLQWVAGHGVTDPAVLESVGAFWNFRDELPTAEDLFDATIKSFAAADAPTQKFVETCQFSTAAVPDPSVLQRDGLGAFYLSNMELYFGRYLGQRQMYEESLERLEKAQLADVVDPAGLLFYKTVDQHQLLRKDEGLKSVAQLLAVQGVPVRYATLASLMQYDFESMKEKSLDEVSRKMSDVERRLNLGRAGPRVQKTEAEIVATLDELIKKIEEQQGGGGGGGAGSKNNSANPANDSVVKGSTAPGEVDKKRFKNEGGWGSLPDKERAKAKDLISRDFPAHYRQAIEEYTRKQATRSAGKRP